MSIYRCQLCDQFKDADFDDCYESPYDECECICEGCMDDYDIDHEREDDEEN